MSNPPLGNPLHSEENDDFSFPIIIAEEEITLDCLLLPSPSMSLPMLDYQDLSTFLDPQDHDFALLSNQLATTIDHHHDHDRHHDDQVQQHQGVDATTSGSRLIESDHHHHHHHQVGGVLEQGQGSSPNKKQAHNAKERVRRLKLNASCLALRSMLPHSKKPKEKWSAPYIIDRALEYIPQVQAEVEKLTLEKTNILSVIAKKQVLASDGQDEEDKDKQRCLTVSLNEVKRGEVIIQICIQTDKDNDFSCLMETLEGDDIQIVGASSVFACEDRTCFHLHVQIGEISPEADYVADLHKKLIAYLS